MKSYLKMALRNAEPVKGDTLIYLGEELVTFVELFYRPGYAIVENENGKQVVVATALLSV